MDSHNNLQQHVVLRKRLSDANYGTAPGSEQLGILLILSYEFVSLSSRVNQWGELKH